MKRKRETKVDEGEICKLGSEWTAKRRPPSTDDRGLTTLGYKFMSSRPSARKSRLGLPKFNTNGNSRTPSEPQQTPEDEEDDNEGDWISQLGAKYMTRKKLYEARGGPLFDCSAHFSPREHELELDNELDNSWIADFGMQWMKRRCRTRKGQYKVHDDAWICELGFQWMSKAREREHANQTWLSDLSSQYMTRRKRELDRGIEELGLTAYRGFLEREEGGDSLWETRRKLQYSHLDSEPRMKRSKHGNGPDFELDKHEVNAPENGQAGVEDGVNASQSGVAPNPNQSGGDDRPNHVEQEAKLIDDTENSCRLVVPLVVDSEFELLDREELDAFDEFQMLEFDPLGDLEPAECVNLDDDDDSSPSTS